MATFVELYGVLLDAELASTDVTNLFTTARRKAAINDAQKEFVRQTGCLTRRAVVPLTTAVGEYDLEVVVAADDFLALTKDGVEIRITNGARVSFLSGQDLPRRDIPWLNRENPGWRSASAATPSAYYIDEDGGKVSLGFTPPPSITAPATWDALVPYVAYPTDMTADADQPFTVAANPKRTLRQYHQGLVHYAAAHLETLRKNYPAFDRQMRLFTSYVTEYLQKQRRPGGSHITLARDYIGTDGNRAANADWWLR